MRAILREGPSLDAERKSRDRLRLLAAIGPLAFPPFGIAEQPVTRWGRTTELQRLRQAQRKVSKRILHLLGSDPTRAS